MKPSPTYTRSAVTNRLLGLLLFVVVSCCQAEMLNGRVVGVVDGDTVDIVTPSNEQVRIRVMGIDAPEKAQAFGQRSKQKMSDFVYGKDAQVEFTKRDRYGRIVGKVIVNGRDAGLGLIDAGLAWHYKKYAFEQPYGDRDTYASAENIARNSRIGLWADAEPIAPWDWRRRSK